MNQRYTKAQITQLCRNLLATSEEYDKRLDRLDSVKVDLLPWVKQVGSWGWLYTKPFSEFCAKFIGLMGFEFDQIFSLSDSMDGQAPGIEALEAHYEQPPDPHGIHELLIVPVVLAGQGHFRAMDLFNQTMDELLVQTVNGDDKALFKAILVDPAVITSSPAQARIAEATLLKDDLFFQLFAKALTQKKPRRPVKKYDAIRYLIGCLDEMHVLDDLTQEEVCDIFINELSLYPHDSLDPNEGLKKLIQTIRSPKKR